MATDVDAAGTRASASKQERNTITDHSLSGDADVYNRTRGSDRGGQLSKSSTAVELQLDARGWGTAWGLELSGVGQTSRRPDFGLVAVG